MKEKRAKAEIILSAKAPWLAQVQAIAKWDETLAGNGAPGVSDAIGNYWVNVQDFPEEEVAGLIAHELMHLFLSHAHRCEVQGLEPHKYNIAGDLVINQLVAAMELSLPTDSLDIKQFGLPANLSEEEYYIRTPKDKDFASGDGNVKGKACHHDMTKQPDPEREALIKAAIVESASALARDENAPRILRDIARGILAPPTINWKRIVRKSVTDLIGGTNRKKHYGVMHRRQSIYGSIIKPGGKKHKNRVFIAVDTSGSMSYMDTLETALAAVWDATKSCEVTAMAVTTVAQEPVKIKNKQDLFKLTSKSGGTDMRVAFDVAREQGVKLILITDGETPFPTINESIPEHYVIVLGNIKVPEHIRHIYINKGERKK